MRVRVTLDEKLLAEAKFYTGFTTDAEILHVALKALIEKEACRRLARLGGSEPNAKATPRRRFPPEATE